MKRFEELDRIDTSYSGIVSELQGDRVRGIELLGRFCEASRETFKVIEQKEADVKRITGDYQTYTFAVGKILKHLEVTKLPVSIIHNGNLYTIGADEKITQAEILNPFQTK